MNKFIVTTTINSPTKATFKFAEIAKNKGWLFVIVGDLKTPHTQYERGHRHALGQVVRGERLF
jgi:hypothetical protein